MCAQACRCVTYVHVSTCLHLSVGMCTHAYVCGMCVHVFMHMCVCVLVFEGGQEAEKRQIGKSRQI